MRKSKGAGGQIGWKGGEENKIMSMSFTLKQLLRDDIYRQASPGAKRGILDEWYDRSIKTDPQYSPEQDTEIRANIFRDVPPTHVEEAFRPAAIAREFPRALAETFRFEDITQPSPRALPEPVPMIKPVPERRPLWQRALLVPIAQTRAQQEAVMLGVGILGETLRRASELVRAPLYEYQRAVREGRPKIPIIKAMDEAARGLRITPGRDIVKNMGVPLDDPKWILDNPGKHFAAEMLGAWYETYGTSPVMMSLWAKSVPYSRKAHIFNQILRETGKKLTPAVIDRAVVPIDPKLAKDISKTLSKGFLGQQVHIAGGLKKLSEVQLKQALKAVRDIRYIPKPAPAKPITPPVGVKTDVPPVPAVKPALPAVRPFAPVVKPPVAAVPTPRVPAVEPLAKEARKHKTAEEFVREDFQNMVKGGQDVINEMKDAGIKTSLNLDGTLTIFHGTSNAKKSKIMKSGIFEEGSFFSPLKGGTKIGDSPIDVAKRKFGKEGTVFEIKVDARDISFSSGTEEIFAERGLIRGVGNVWNSPNRPTEQQLTDFHAQAIKEVKPPVAARVPRELETEARKYKTAEEFYIRTGGGKYNIDFIEKIEKAKDKDIVGTLNDFIIGAKTRKALGKNVLNTKIIVKKNISDKVPMLGGVGILKKDSRWGKKGDRIILIDNKLSHIKTDIIDTILEEAAHTKRAVLGRDMKEINLAKLNLDVYEAMPQEISGKKFGKFLHKIKEDRSQLTDIWKQAQAPKPAPAVKPVKEIQKPTAKKVTILPRKAQLLIQIDTAIKKAPDIEPTTRTPKVSFQIDGGAEIFNTKKALTEFGRRVKRQPEKITVPAPKPTVKGRLLPARKEEIGELRKGVKGYYTDGAMAIKGTPPARVKYGEKTASTQDVERFLAYSTKPAEIAYYGTEGVGVGDAVSKQPVLAMAEETPLVVFKFADKYVTYSQYRFNHIRNKFPTAKYGVTEGGVLIAKVDNEPVAALMPMPAPGVREAITKTPPFGERAIEAGFVEAKPVVTPKTPSGVATVGVFRTGEDVKLGNIDKIKPVEFPELVEITKDLMGRVPEVSRRLRKALGKFYATEKGRIKLTPEIFKKENSDQLAKVLAHEIGHLVDYLPHQTLKRGNLLGHLLSLRGFLKNRYGTIQITNKGIREELKTASNYWRPWDRTKATASFRGYRDSAKELYADAVSMLLNNPGKLEEMAPQFYKSFFEYLDRKPEVKNAYFKLQETLSQDRETLVRLRRERVQEMFTQANYKSKELQKIKEKERKIRLKDFWEMFTYAIKSINQPVYNKVRMLQKQGVHIPDEENPEYMLSGRNYLSGLVKGEFKENIQPVMTDLLKNDIDWKTFGESLYYDRIIAGDRSEFANPRGITPKAAEELKASIKESLGDRYKILEDNADKFRGYLKGLSERAHKEGMFTKEMFDIVKGNDKYVPFQVVEYMENYVAWKTAPQVGTLKDISNPANSLLLKAVSTIRAIERQKVRMATFKVLEQNFPGEVQEAKTRWTGKGHEPVPSRDPKLELVTYYKDGKLRGKYVDPYIARSLEGDTIAANRAVMTLLSPGRFVNKKLLRPLFVVYNPGWIPFNFIRDFMRTWKNTPELSMYRLLKLYGKAFRPARVRAFGLGEKPTVSDIEAEALITKLEKEEVLSITWNDFLMGQTTEDVQIEAVFEQMGLAESKREIPTVVRGLEKVLNKTGVNPVLEWIRNMGGLVETLPKVAGYYELEGKMPPQEMRTFIRRNIGSPDFFEKGYLTPATNEVFLFSNAFTQAVSADAGIATNPKTRSGFWWKTAKANYLPKLLMFAALAGAFGKKVKDMMGDASEYDLTNYMVVPIGRDTKSGKTIYVRIPTDETSRLLGGVLWKGMNAFRNNQSFIRDVADIASLFGGQLPGLSPAIEVPLSTATFLSGRNPYDAFRGRMALTDKQIKAGGWYALRPFLIWQFQQMGGNIFMKIYAGERTPTQKSIGEKILQGPVISNVAGRFIKISDFGAIERYRKTTDIVKQRRARKSIDESRILNDYIKKYQEKKGTESQLLSQLTAEVLRDIPRTREYTRRRKALQKKFRVSILRGKADPIINSFITAWTNDEKVELLKVFREEMSAAEFSELRNTLRRYKIVSGSVLYRVRK